MKKLLGSLMVGALVFGAALASASTLAVSGGTLQNGTITDLSCQKGAVTVSYVTQIEGDAQSHVTAVKLHGIEGACYGKWADVMLMPAGPFQGGVPWIAGGWGTLPNTPDATIDLQPNQHPLSSQVGQVNITIRDN